MRGLFQNKNTVIESDFNILCSVESQILDKIVGRVH